MSKNSAEPVTLIVPVFNEVENFPRLVENVERHIPQPYRMVVTYDFDQDTTLPVARELAQTRPEIELVKNEFGRGPANAIRAGFDAVESGPAIVVMADCSDDLSDVDEMLEKYREGAQVVCASRYMPGGGQEGGPWLKRTLSRWAGLSLYLLARFPTRDATNNFRLYDAELVSELHIESEHGFEIALELTAKAFLRGATIVEIPTHWTDRTDGESNFKLFKWLPLYLKWYWVALKAGWSPRRGKMESRDYR